MQQVNLREKYRGMDVVVTYVPYSVYSLSCGVSNFTPAEGRELVTVIIGRDAVHNIGYVTGAFNKRYIDTCCQRSKVVRYGEIPKILIGGEIL